MTGPTRVFGIGYLFCRSPVRMLLQARTLCVSSCWSANFAVLFRGITCPNKDPFLDVYYVGPFFYYHTFYKRNYIGNLSLLYHDKTVRTNYSPAKGVGLL